MRVMKMANTASLKSTMRSSWNSFLISSLRYSFSLFIGSTVEVANVKYFFPIKEKRKISRHIFHDQLNSCNGFNNLQDASGGSPSHPGISLQPPVIFLHQIIGR